MQVPIQDLSINTAFSVIMLARICYQYKFTVGAVYVYCSNDRGLIWSQRQKLVAADGTAGDQLGISVAMCGYTIVAGAFYDDAGIRLEIRMLSCCINNFLLFTHRCCVCIPVVQQRSDVVTDPEMLLSRRGYRRLLWLLCCAE